MNKRKIYNLIILIILGFQHKKCNNHNYLCLERKEFYSL